MQFGAMNSPINPVEDEIEKIAALGFDYFELTMDAPRAHFSQINRQQAAIHERLKRLGLGLVCHMPTFVYTADLTDSIRRASLAEVLSSLETAAALQASKIVLHPSILSGLGPLIKDTAVGYALASLEAVVRRARSLGLTLCVENMFPRLGYMVEPGEFAALFERFADLKLTLDTGHAFIGAHAEDRILDYISRLGPRLGHVHVSDNLGKRDDHFPLGKGKIKFKKIVQALDDLGYDDTITLEIFSQDPGDLKTSLQKINGWFGGWRD